MLMLKIIFAFNFIISVWDRLEANISKNYSLFNWC